MFKVSFIAVILLAFASIGHSQNPSTTPTPKGDDDVVKISTHLIQIDVTVTDKGGKVVRGLKPDDFEIYENGQKQSISNFSFVSNVKESTIEPGPADNKKQVVLPSSPIRPEQIHRTIALVVDDLSLSFESTYFARRALKKFVDEQMLDGDLVAIIRTGGGIGALQQFTTDKRQLYAAIEHIRWNPMGTGSVSAFEPMEAKVDLGPDPPDNGRTPEEMKKDQDSFRASIFATGTLGAINYVVRGMQELPGRKSIMLVSDGFKLYEENHLTGTRDYGRVLEALRRLADAANRASVVVNTIDARGLVITGLTAADDASGRSADEIESELTDRRSQLFDTQDGLIYLARETGGIAIKNTNDLSGGIRRILDDQSYYLIGYIPDTDTFDPRSTRFNKLAVKVKQTGVNVRYRSGFFGTSDEDRNAAASGPTGRNKLFSAVTSPFSASQIPVRLNALFNLGTDGTSFVRSLLHVDISQIKFEELPNKSKSAVIDVLVVAFGDNGAVIDQSGKSFTLEMPPAVYEKYLREGLVHIFTFPVKKPGAYQLRVAIRDTATDKVGSSNQFIEIPDLKKDRLVLSGVVLENIPLDEWQLRNAKGSAPSSTTAFNDTSTRQFKTGTVLNYGYSVFNSKPGSPTGRDLETQTRMFRDGKLIFEGKPQKAVSQKSRPNAVDLAGSLLLGTEMVPGDYVMQITVTDKLLNPKRNSASQFVQFELIP